jgi:hypothetical protein
LKTKKENNKVFDVEDWVDKYIIRKPQIKAGGKIN